MTYDPERHHRRFPPDRYPIAAKPSRVGKYPGLVGSGGGYFYDEVLEYRVWIHPEAGGEDSADGSDYFRAFASFEEAARFSRRTRGAEPPVALVLQREWIDEPEPGKFIPRKGRRLTEWRVEWLPGRKRTKDSIAAFLKERGVCPRGE